MVKNRSQPMLSSIHCHFENSEQIYKHIQGFGDTSGFIFHMVLCRKGPVLHCTSNIKTTVTAKLNTVCVVPYSQ